MWRLAILPLHPGDAGEFDALVAEFFGFVVGRLAVDIAMGDLAMVDATGLVGELGTDIVAAGFDLGPQFLQLPLRLGQLRRHLLARHVAALADARRHRRLLDLAAAAGRAGDRPGLGLAVVGGVAREPRLEHVALGAAEVEQEHAPTLRTTMVNSRLACLINILKSSLHKHSIVESANCSNRAVTGIGRCVTVRAKPLPGSADLPTGFPPAVRCSTWPPAAAGTLGCSSHWAIR